jgi:hypothetical protein
MLPQPLGYVPSDEARPCRRRPWFPWIAVCFCLPGVLSLPAVSVRPALKDFAAASTDDELRRFVAVMQSGSDAEQAAAVEAAMQLLEDSRAGRR